MSQKKAGLSKEKIEKLHGAFDLFDQDRSGSISSSELKKVLKALHLEVSSAQLQQLMKQMDTDGNGTIEFNEFVKAMQPVYEREVSDDEMRNAFRSFDTDNSGYITLPELREILGALNVHLSDRRLGEIVREFDKDGDGKISYQEFVRMMRDA